MTNFDIVGVWKLESFKTGSELCLTPWGEGLRGLLFYAEEGYVSVAITRNTGQSSFDPVKDSLFYAGTFGIDGSSIRHHIQIATNAERLKAPLVRDAKFDGKHLVLTGVSETGTHFKLVWARVT